MKAIFFFDSMLTPKLVTALYWLLLLSAFLGGLSVMFGGVGGFTLMQLVFGLFTIAAGSVAARIWCELMIVIFKINENLQALRDMKNRQV